MSVSHTMPLLGSSSRFSPATRIREFFFAPASGRPFTALRISVAVVLLAQAISIFPHFFALHGSTGILQGRLGESLNAISEIPPLFALANWLALPWLSSDRLSAAAGLLYVLSLAGLLTGHARRAFAIGAWLMHTLLIGSGSATKYGADEFAQIALFYVALIPGRGCASESTNRFVLRLLQIHLCVAYLATGLAKAQGAQWWDGEAIWRSLTLPIYTQFDFTWMARAPWLAKLSGWGTLLVEIGYALFIWPRHTRRLWAALIIGMHLGIALFLGLWVFGLLMILLTTAAFLVSPELTLQRSFGLRA